MTRKAPPATPPTRQQMMAQAWQDRKIRERLGMAKARPTVRVKAVMRKLPPLSDKR